MSTYERAMERQSQRTPEGAQIVRVPRLARDPDAEIIRKKLAYGDNYADREREMRERPQPEQERIGKL
jgi:hypothetical protein